MIADRWSRANAGRGQCVLLTAEAGVGKSRVVEHFEGHTRGDDRAWLELRCSADRTNSALHPVIELVRASLHLDPAAPHESQLMALASGLADSGVEGDESFALFARLLGLPAPGRVRASSAG